MEFKDNAERELYLCVKFFLDTYSREKASFGLVPDCYPHKYQNTSSIAGTGFFFCSLVIAAEYGYLPKEEAKMIAIKSMTTLTQLATLHGWYYHFYETDTGLPTRFAEVSTIDTALLLGGVLSAAGYFGGRCLDIAHGILNRVNFPYFCTYYRTMFSMAVNYQHEFIGHWDRYAEQLILYVLGCANMNPAHHMDPSLFYSFQRDWGEYKGHGFIHSWHGSIFTYQFSHAFVDFRGLLDRRGVDWFENSVQATLAAYEYAKDNEGKFKSLHRYSWGLTACACEGGYSGRYGALPNGEGRTHNDGTMAPYGAVASIVFAPKQALEALDFYYRNPKLINDYGLVDSYNEDTDYYCPYYISIDKGISMVMLANARDGIIWKSFMSLDVIKRALVELGLLERK